MKAYKITNGQRNSITKPQKFNGLGFNPRQDINGDWHIWQIEADYCEKHFGWQLIENEFIEPLIEDSLI